MLFLSYCYIDMHVQCTCTCVDYALRSVLPGLCPHFVVLFLSTILYFIFYHQSPSAQKLARKATSAGSLRLSPPKVGYYAWIDR